MYSANTPDFPRRVTIREDVFTAHAGDSAWIWFANDEGVGVHETWTEGGHFYEWWELFVTPEERAAILEASKAGHYER